MSRDEGKPDQTVFAGSTTPPRSAILEPGAVVAGRYVIERELGRGGIGVVYFARDRQLHNKPVVLKALLDSTRDNQWLKRKFHQEVEALARVDHPGIVGVLDAGDLGDGTSYFVMQFVDGSPLRSAMRPGRMPIERASSIFKQLGRALAAAHERGIFHRDLKPENVMLQPLAGGDEQVKVIDFGVAHIKDSVVAPDTATNVAVGTVIYMAPEQLGAKEITAATDVYALGVLAYEMLTGHRPFEPATMFQLLELQRQGVRTLPSSHRPELGNAVDEIILRALAFDQDARYQSAREFGDDLARALAGRRATEPMAAGASAPLAPTETELGNTANVPTDAGKSAPTREHDGRATIPGTEATPTVAPETKPAPPLERKTARATAPPRPETAADEPATPEPAPPPAPTRPPWVPVIVGAALLAAVAIAALAWVTLRPPPGPSTNTNAATNAATNASVPPIEPAGAPRHLRFSLAVQKMRDGKPYDTPFQASGQEIFENGYRFWMNVTSADAGYFYVVNEGPAPRDGAKSYNFLHPVSGGPAEIAANETISIPSRDTSGYQFDTEKGTEKMWLVWSKSPVPELERAKRVANPTDGGVISDPSDVAALEKLLAQADAARPKVVKNGDTKEIEIEGRGDRVVVLQPLEHQ